MSTGVLIVEDHPIFRDGLTALLGSHPDLRLVAAVATADEALTVLGSEPIDIVLMDLNLPRMSGVEATSRITALPASPAVLVVTMVDDDDTVIAAMRAGARGYVLKGSSGEDIVAAIHTVVGGGAVFGPGIARQVLSLTSGQTRVRADDGLTERERSVLALLAEGTSNAVIARTLGLSVKTVQNYVSRILTKLQLADRTQAAIHARGDLHASKAPAPLTTPK